MNLKYNLYFLKQLSSSSEYKKKKKTFMIMYEISFK